MKFAQIAVLFEGFFVRSLFSEFAKEAEPRYNHRKGILCDVNGSQAGLQFNK
jgi:hypothetical protein